MLSKDDILTLKAVVLFILKNCKDDKRDVYAIVKTAYYAQQFHFKDFGLPLFKDQIKALQFGPVPSNVYDILKQSRGDDVSAFHVGEEFYLASSAIKFENEYFYAKEEPDMNYLSKSALQCLTQAVQKVSLMDFNEIKEDTHGEEWMRVYHGDVKNKIMDNVNIAKEAGAEEGSLNYLKDYLDVV